MDDEVSTLPRIRGESPDGPPTLDGVGVALGPPAKVITAAALIMISVFLGFVAGDDPVVKMMGVGLATAVAVDAPIVRMVLVPPPKGLMGDANWWLPKRCPFYTSDAADAGSRGGIGGRRILKKKTTTNLYVRGPHSSSATKATVTQ